MVMAMPKTTSNIKVLFTMIKYDLEYINGEFGISLWPYEYLTHVYSENGSDKIVENIAVLHTSERLH